MRSLALTLTMSGLLAAFLGAGCRHQPEARTPKVPVVRYTKAISKQVSQYEYFTGRTEAIKSVEIRARVTGYLVEINFKPGAEVKKDDQLFLIDPRPYKADLDQANAQVLLAKAQLQLAIADLERGKEIDKTPGAISKQDLDKYAAAQSQADAQVKAATAAADQADLNYQWTKVTTLIDGLTGRNLLDVGNLVTKDQTLLTTVVSQGKMYGYFDVDELLIKRIQDLIREGKVKSARKYDDVPVELGLINEGDSYPHVGTIDFVGNRIDPGTGTLQIRGIFDNPKAANGGPALLTPGMFIRIRFPVGEKKEELLVPQIAIGTDQGKKFLLVVNEGNVVEYRPVTLGQVDGELQAIEPLKIVRTDKGVRLAGKDESGEDSLKVGERVIVGGLQRVRPGIKVEAKDANLEVK
jgi:membrane fusion protein, multidrug efflux system